MYVCTYVLYTHVVEASGRQEIGQFSEQRLVEQCIPRAPALMHRVIRWLVCLLACLLALVTSMQDLASRFANNVHLQRPCHSAGGKR